MSDIIKPDFEKLAERICSQWNYHTRDDVDSMKEGMDKIWTDHVEPLLSSVKRLQEENEQYKGKLDFYRNETSKLRTFLEDNRIGKPNQKLFDALYDHLVQLQEDKKELVNEVEQLILNAEEDSSTYSVLEHARKLVFKMNAPDEYAKSFPSELNKEY